MPVLGGQLWMRQLLGGAPARGAEIVTQAQCVAHLVHGGVLQVGQHEVAHLWAVRIEFTPCASITSRPRASCSSRQVTVQTVLVVRMAGVICGGRPAAQDLAAHGADAARGQALQRDVRAQDLTRARVHVRGADGAKAGLRIGHPADGGLARGLGVDGLTRHRRAHLDRRCDSRWPRRPGSRQAPRP